LRNAVLFLPNGKGSPLLFAQWRRRAPAKPIQSRNVLTDGGTPSRYFADLWREAFPTRRPLPGKIAERDGRGTDEFWDVFG
jgi:hypothetical protein